MNYTIFKNDHDGFMSLNPKAIFQREFGQEAGIIYDSEYANYNNRLYNKIESMLIDFEKLVMKSSINSNFNLVDHEIVYYSKNPKTPVLIAIKQYWDIDEYAPSELQDYGIEEEEIPKEFVKVTKKTPFQAKITFYAKQTSDKETLLFLDNLYKKLISKDKKPKERERTLDIICNSSDGLYLKPFKTKKINLNIEESYNDNFQDISDTIIKRLSKKDDNGIILLHSDPGAGKTTYLRYLTNKIKDKRLIYLPPDMVYRLSEPDFMSFLMSYPNSVLFIEDAETCLQKRENGGNQAVSNLLNSSDGLLGDALKIQIVCTFNCDLKAIDQALLRPGRLIAEHRLDKLSKVKVETLIKKLYGEDSEFIKDAKEMTLAEIYNLNVSKFQSSNTQINKIGFNQ